MSDPQPDRTGVLGRGPRFWLGMMLASLGLIAALSMTGAIEERAIHLLLLIIPTALLVPVALSVSRRKSGSACGGSSVAQARYVKRVAIFTVLYLASFGLLSLVQDNAGLAYPLRLSIGFLPGLAVVGVFWAIARLIVEETDEFQRMLVVRQSLIASALALSAASIWGFLESGDLVPHIDAYWYAVIWFGGLLVGAIVNRVQYGSWGAL